MKFYPPEGAQELQIALTSGHTCLITEDGNEIPALFHKEAIAKGCRIENVVDAKVDSADPQFDRRAKIAEAIDDMVDAGDQEEFTNDGKPDVRAVSKRVGFNVTREERDEIWTAMSANPDGSTAPGEGE